MKSQGMNLPKALIWNWSFLLSKLLDRPGDSQNLTYYAVAHRMRTDRSRKFFPVMPFVPSGAGRNRPLMERPMSIPFTKHEKTDSSPGRLIPDA